ncbi:MAG: hypothetical protein IKU24_00930 [Clostridia bacterium]|nr:hypothetical protein [Clostridia bacterium]
MQQILESLSVIFISPLKDELAGLMWCVFLAMVLVLVSTLRQRATLGKVIEKIKEKGAISEETALSAKELGKIPSSAVKGKFRLIESVQTKEGIKYFLPQRNLAKADAILKAGSTPLWLALVELAAFYILLVIIYYVLPYLLDGFRNL